MKFPENIEKYLQENGIGKNSLYYLVTSTNGEIEDVGNSKVISISAPVKGELIANVMPVFEGFFPLKEQLYLPNIQLFHHRYFNIYLVPLKDKIWILIDEVTQKVNRLKQKAFNDNEKINNELQLLTALDFFVLKEKAVNVYEPVLPIPGWASNSINGSTEQINLNDAFPFLAFYSEQKENHTLFTGVWTQIINGGIETHLKAWFVPVLNDWFLLIQPANAEKDNNIIQLARENTLAYEQLKKTKAQLQELVKLKDEFVNIVSHDLRSPISTLTDGISFLLEDLDGTKSFDSSHREIIEQVREELVRLLDYNNKLYNWTKLNLDSIELNVTKVSLDLLLTNLNGKFDKRLNEKNIRLILTIYHHVEIQTDYVLLNQAISNLVDNAIKFSKVGSDVKLVVNEHSLMVVDQGVGIPEEKIDEIMKGYSLKSSQGTSGEKGTGLGLNIVTRIIKTLNYNLEIKSEIGKGTTFIISF